ncbi:MAG: STAS domain-containing protein [Spirochaetales bacterium]|nr:STAS domain-containing protein [Spirochaetales bacterium]
MARKKNPVVVNLPSEFQISLVNDKYDEFVKVIHEERPVVIDMAEVNSVDYAGLQLLYSLMRSCEEKELPFSLANLPSPIEKKIDLCGLDQLKEGVHGSV